jgi:hypothetical protein
MTNNHNNGSRYQRPLDTRVHLRPSVRRKTPVLSRLLNQE